MNYKEIKESAEKAKVLNILLDGLVYDGAHHKQYYLYQACLALGYNDEDIYKELAREEDMTVNEYKRKYGTFDKGVPA